MTVQDILTLSQRQNAWFKRVAGQNRYQPVIDDFDLEFIKKESELLGKIGKRTQQKRVSLKGEDLNIALEQQEIEMLEEFINWTEENRRLAENSLARRRLPVSLSQLVEKGVPAGY